MPDFSQPIKRQKTSHNTWVSATPPSTIGDKTAYVYAALQKIRKLPRGRSMLMCACIVQALNLGKRLAKAWANKKQALLSTHKFRDASLFIHDDVEKPSDYDLMAFSAKAV